jgi:thioredoxin-dependent peroxiredoxin
MAKATTGKKQAKASAKSAPRKPTANAKAKGKPAPKVPAKPAPKGKPAGKKPSVQSAKPVGKTKTTMAGAVRTVARAAKKVVAAVKKVAGSSSSPSGGGRIQAGSVAPSFQLKDQTGTVVSSASLKGKPYVLYFYPKDDTTGCTREACGFRDAHPAFGKHGARVIGVSPDSEASHAKFAGKYGLPFTLLSDPDKVLAKAYGAWGPKKNYGREYMGIIRSTFVVDAAGKVKRAYYGVKVDGHVDSVLGDVS